jgi:hypothetical protein
VKKQIEGRSPGSTTTPSAGHHDRQRPSSRTISTRSRCRIDEDPPEINIRFFPTGHWLIGMGHDRATSGPVRDPLGDAIFQITGSNRDLPWQARSQLG